MKRKWILLLGGWLMVVVVLGCGQTATPATPSDEAAAATATVAPIDTPETQPSPAISAPAPLWTVAPISPTQVIQEEAVTVNPTISTPSNPALQNLVMQAKEDLARRLSIEADQIELLEIKSVVWPDSSMGCPQPGMMYTQVQHDGALIRLRVGKDVYNYHSGGARPPFLCEQAVGQTVGSDSLVPPPGLGDQ